MASKVKGKSQVQDPAGVPPRDASTDRPKRKGRTNSSRLSSKHQVTIPVDVMREAGFNVGDELIFKVEDNQVTIQTRRQDLLAWIAGFNGFYDGYDFAAERADAWPD